MYSGPAAYGCEAASGAAGGAWPLGCVCAPLEPVCARHWPGHAPSHRDRAAHGPWAYGHATRAGHRRRERDVHFGYARNAVRSPLVRFCLLTCVDAFFASGGVARSETRKDQRKTYCFILGNTNRGETATSTIDDLQSNGSRQTSQLSAPGPSPLALRTALTLCAVRTY